MYIQKQCVQSKHREITNYYINITVAFIAYSISDLVFLEGQSLYTNSKSLLVLQWNEYMITFLGDNHSNSLPERRVIVARVDEACSYNLEQLAIRAPYTYVAFLFYFNP